VSARLWWWAMGVGPGLACGALAALGAMDGNWGAAFAYTGWACWLVLSLVLRRREFRRGWHAGLIEGVFVASPQLRREATPLHVVRQIATGLPAPEPWDPLVMNARTDGRERG
jgi:hypothetical protein